jgi:hypothetical protein
MSQRMRDFSAQRTGSGGVSIRTAGGAIERQRRRMFDDGKHVTPMIHGTSSITTVQPRKIVLVRHCRRRRSSALAQTGIRLQYLAMDQR